MSEPVYFGTIHDFLDTHDSVRYKVGTHPGDDEVVTITRDSSSTWTVFRQDRRIGTLEREQRDRASFYVSRVAGDDHLVDWVSDDISGPISRMITLAD